MKKQYSILIALFAIVLFSVSCKKDKTVPELPKVLVIGSESDSTWIIDVMNKIDSTELFSLVDTFNMKKRIPTLTLLEAYDAVLVFTDSYPLDAALTGDALAAYINLGGGVVNATFTGNIPITGAFVQYALLTGTSQTGFNGNSLGEILVPNHPILKDVLTFNGGISSYHNNGGDLDAGAIVVAKYDDDEPLVIVKENVGPANANRVFLNFYPPSAHARADFWDPTTDGAQLMAGALLWVIK